MPVFFFHLCQPLIMSVGKDNPGPSEGAPSEVSLGFPEAETRSTAQADFLKNCESQSVNHKILSDVYCLGVICKRHQRIALQRFPNNSYFLPYDEVKSDRGSFQMTSQDLLKRILPHGM